MRTDTRIAATILALAGAPAMAQCVPGYDLSTYAEVSDPFMITLGPDAQMYVGRDLSGSGGSPGASTTIHFVAGAGSVTEYGDAIPDPDTVLYDADGQIAGVPGAVIVGGRLSTRAGRISAILPDQSVITLFELSDHNNPSEMKIASNGQLLYCDGTSGGVVTIDDGVPVQLFPTPGPAYHLAVDDAGRVFTSTADGRILLHDANGTLINDRLADLDGRVSIEVAPFGAERGLTLLYALETVSGDLFTISDAGDVTLIGQGLSGAGDIAFAPDGTLFVSDFEHDRIIQLAPTPGGPCPIDLAVPFCVLDIFDIVEYLMLFQSQNRRADIAEPFGVFDVFDVISFLQIFDDGCPEDQGTDQPDPEIIGG